MSQECKHEWTDWGFLQKVAVGVILVERKCLHCEKTETKEMACPHVPRKIPALHTTYVQYTCDWCGAKGQRFHEARYPSEIRWRK